MLACDNHRMPEYRSKEERARAALLLARQHYEVQALAADLGTNRQKISAFLNGGELKDADLLSRIVEWTRGKGYWLWESGDPVPGTVPITQEMQEDWARSRRALRMAVKSRPIFDLANRMEMLAAVLLEDCYTPAQKEQDLVHFVEHLHGSIKTYVAALQNLAKPKS